MVPATATRLVALAGNPNTGKSTLFNRLTGGRARVGNYPGVTVEREAGTLRLPHAGEVTLLDVPGTYSLSARSGEEQIALAAIAGLSPLERPEAVVLVADATQLTRNLYLALQVIECGLPLVLALNMTDMLAERGLEIDAAALERALGVPVVPIQATNGDNVPALVAALDAVLRGERGAAPGPRWLPESEALRADVAAVAEALPEAWTRGRDESRAALALWSLLSLDDQDEITDAPQALRRVVDERRRAAERVGREIESEIISGRYAWIDAHSGAFLRSPTTPRATRTDRIDSLLLHPALGFATFLLVMGVVFQSLFSWSDPAIGWIEGLFGWISERAAALLPAGFLADLVTNGLIQGVGSVLVFLPQIALLFLFIAVMEDSGYMARVAYLMDRLMKAIGLHGRAFVPMMSGFACAVPAILATRTMERRRDRFLTMMVVPLMTCSARLPVYALIIGALFPPSDVLGVLPLQGLLMVGMYLFSTLMALAVAAVLGRTVLRGPRVPLLLEMPPYRLPSPRGVLLSVWRRSAIFVREAGTVILACTVGMWLLLSFPHSDAVDAEFDARRTALEAEAPASELDERLSDLERERSGALLRETWGARLGHALEPALEPLGFDWKIGVGLVGAFAAREVFISTMGLVYGLGDEVDERSVGLRERIRAATHEDGRPVYSPLVGLSLMVFFALACQCMSTLAVVRRETRSWAWPTFLFTYTLALAWVASFAVYQGGRLLFGA
ncbi:MAG TPA: ferrous iron transport protein B [Planctomycetota bacterium]|nr:ferrous iron transport protein B [Planctomycetota bacterium]